MDSCLILGTAWFLALVVGVNVYPADVARVEAYCASLRVLEASCESGARFLFTGPTLTNAYYPDGIPLVSSELAEQQPDTFSSKWILRTTGNLPWPAGTLETMVDPFSTNGSFSIRIQASDRNNNFIPDWMEHDLSAELEVSGSMSPTSPASASNHWQGGRLTGKFLKPAGSDLATLDLKLASQWRTNPPNAGATTITNRLIVNLIVRRLEGTLEYDRSLLTTNVEINLVGSSPDDSLKLEGNMYRRTRGSCGIMITNASGLWRMGRSEVEFQSRDGDWKSLNYAGYASGLSSPNADGDTRTPWRDFSEWRLFISDDSDWDMNGFSDLTDGPSFPFGGYVETVSRSTVFELGLATMSMSPKIVWIDVSDDLRTWKPFQRVLVANFSIPALDPEFVRKYLLPVRSKVEIPIEPEGRMFRIY